MNHTKQVKLQKWTSLFIYLKRNILIDIATLNNERSKLVEVDDLFQSYVEEARS